MNAKSIKVFDVAKTAFEHLCSPFSVFPTQPFHIRVLTLSLEDGGSRLVTSYKNAAQHRRPQSVM